MLSDRKYTSTAVERALEIIDAIAQRGGMTNAAVARRLGMPKSSAWYILRTLQAQGYVIHDPDSGTYRLNSSKIATLTQYAVTDVSITRLAGPVVGRLREHTQLCAGITHFDTVVQCVNGPKLKFADCASPKLALHTTAAGKLVLAYLPEPEMLALLRERGMPRWTPRTITQQSRLIAELELIRKRDYAIDDEESVRGLRCLTAPIFGPLGIIKGSIGVVGTTADLCDDKLPRVAIAVRQSAAAIMGPLNSPHQLSVS